MSVTDHDNRIQLPPTPVDFDNVVGVTGQLHDTYPAPGQEPRYDWMRSFLIGLLSMQSSYDPPTQYRVGTPWFNKTKAAIYIWNGTAWVSFANVIAVVETSSGIISLADQLAIMEQQLASIQPRLTFSGYCIKNNVYSIPVPATVQAALGQNVANLRPTVHINGLLIDPRKTNFAGGCPAKIDLTGGAKLCKDNFFTVIIERFDVFFADDVVAS